MPTLFRYKGIYGFLTCGQGQALRVFRKISTPPLSGSIFLKNLVRPKPYTFIVPEQNQHTPAHWTHIKKSQGYESKTRKQKNETE